MLLGKFLQIWFLTLCSWFVCYSAALTIGYVMQKRNLSYKWVSVIWKQLSLRIEISVLLVSAKPMMVYKVSLHLVFFLAYSKSIVEFAEEANSGVCFCLTDLLYVTSKTLVSKCTFSELMVRVSFIVVRVWWWDSTVWLITWWKVEKKDTVSQGEKVKSSYLTGSILTSQKQCRGSRKLSAKVQKATGL